MPNRKRAARAAKNELAILCFALPSLVGLLGFYVIPFFASLYLALVDNSVTGRFVGMQNFIEVAESGAFQLALKNTAAFIAVCVPVNMVVPMGMAMLIKRAGKLKNIYGLFFLLPLVIPSGSIVHFWKSVFGMNGIINGVFFSETPVNWLDTALARSIITLVFIWKNAGYNMVLYVAGLDLIPREYYECASLEGAGRIRQFFSVTMVYIIPTSFLVFIMSVINSFKSFKEIYLLAGGYPHQSIYMLQHYMNNQFASLNYQKLSSASYILSVFIIIVVALLFRIQNKLTKNF